MEHTPDEEEGKIGKVHKTSIVSQVLKITQRIEFDQTNFVKFHVT